MIASNPIITREVRARWRTWGSPALLLLLLAGLAFAMGSAYDDNIWRWRQNSELNNRAAKSAGRDIFIVLAMLECGAWTLLAPVLTAMNIAAERERGLLESLQLSPLRAWQIIAGKLFSAAAFILLTALVTLPVTGLTFLMGGVSPSEFFGVFALHCCIAITGASIGMMCSARARRPLPALISSMALMALWFFGSGLLMIGGQTSFGFSPPTVSPFYAFCIETAQWAGFTNPLLATYLIVNPRELTRGGGFPLPGAPDFPYWCVCPAFCLVVSIFCWWLAARAVRKPFPPTLANDRHWTQLLVRSNSTVPAQKTIDAPLDNVLVREMPLNNWVKFSNPILRREVRGAFRFRRSKAWQGIAQTFVAAIIFGALILIFLNGLDPLSDRRETWEFFTNVGLILLVAASALWSAKSFTRERESGMAEGLGLSLLSPWEIVSAKVFAPLLTFGIYAVPVLITLLPCINWAGISATELPGIGDFFCALAVLASTVFFVVAFGLYISHWHTRTTNAVITVIVALLILWTVTPIFIEPIARILSEDAYRTSNTILHLTNPFVALNEIMTATEVTVPTATLGIVPGDVQYVRAFPRLSWFFCLLTFATGGTFILLLFSRLERSFPRARRALNNLVEPAHEPDSLA
ncbi:MAG TPA: ABC transporter permease [Abditibacteriaceae bacterium]|jgi:ABC-type transport system involved in multi-copper enzyme maturation permease subunit